VTRGDTVKELLKALDKYPHIQKRLSILWGMKDCRNYLESMILDDRVGDYRTGFPFDVMMTIEALIDLHDRQYPNCAPTKKPWDR